MTSAAAPRFRGMSEDMPPALHKPVSYPATQPPKFPAVLEYETFYTGKSCPLCAVPLDMQRNIQSCFLWGKSESCRMRSFWWKANLSALSRTKQRSKNSRFFSQSSDFLVPVPIIVWLTKYLLSWNYYYSCRHQVKAKDSSSHNSQETCSR